MKKFITHLEGIKPIHQRFLIEGRSIVPGFAVGRVFHYRDIITREIEVRDLTEHQVRTESLRIQKALEKVHQDLSQMRKTVQDKIGSEHAKVFQVHQAILKDLHIMSEIEKGLRDRLVNAEHIVQEVFKRWEKKLQGLDSDIHQGRSSDVADLGRRILSALAGIDTNVLSNIAPDSVIFAKRLLPSDTIHLKERNARAIVTEEGSRNSHTAILAKALDIPLICEIDTHTGLIPEGAQVVVDGERGRIIVNPTKQEIHRYTYKYEKICKEKSDVTRRVKKYHLHYKGQTIRIDANASTFDDFKMARKYGAEGIGLYRIESIYMQKTNLLSENYLYAQLDDALAHMAEQEITIRLLDIGGDKTLPYLETNEYPNPSLGVRGVRMLLKHPDLLKNQLRVCLRLSDKYKIRVLVPMVTLTTDMIGVRRYFEEAQKSLEKEEVRFDPSVPLGSMIETPAAVMGADEIMDVSDFVCIGTNDLTQYIMAADREKISVMDYFEAGNRLVMRCVAEVVQKARARNMDCCLCGELAADFSYTRTLLDFGLTHFSVVPCVVPILKDKIQSLSEAEESLLPAQKR